MILSFADRGTEDVFHGIGSARARRLCPPALERIARRKLDALNQAEQLFDLAAPPGNRLEPLFGDRLNQYSIRINRQFRICFRWTPDGPADVQIVDYH